MSQHRLDLRRIRHRTARPGVVVGKDAERVVALERDEPLVELPFVRHTRRIQPQVLGEERIRPLPLRGAVVVPLGRQVQVLDLIVRAYA